MSTTAVVGAGMLGLVVALRACQQGDTVTVLERDEVPGGLASSFVPVSGADPIERFYHHIFRSDRAMVALIDEMGLSSQLLWRRPLSACLYEGRLQQLDTPASLLRFAPLRLHERLRLILALGTLKVAPSAIPFEGVLAQRWLRTISGDRAHSVVFEPLFSAKFGPYAEDISLAWFWARIHDRTPSLGYLQGGFSSLYEALVRELRSRGAKICFGAPVHEIRRDDGRLRVRLAGEADAAEYDRVVATIPVRRLAQLTPQFPTEYLSRYLERPGLMARCVVLVMNRSLSPAYWINMCEPGSPFMVAVEHTNFIDPERYGGQHILYLGNYGESFPHVSGDELLDSFEPWLRRINPAFTKDWVSAAHQFVAPDAQPIVTPGYREGISPHKTPIDGLYVANLFQVYPHDRGQNYAVTMAGQLAASLDKARAAA